MKKSIQRIILSVVSILGVSTIIWILLMLNPSTVYGKSKIINGVTIYYNSTLENSIEPVIHNALKIIESSEIFYDDHGIQLCLNDQSIYPNLYPFAGGTAYAFLNKTVVYDSQIDSYRNRAQFRWEINNNELRQFDLTALLAHEFMHNIQAHYNPKYYVLSTMGKINWKLEGHAEYISREFKNDGKLLEKLQIFFLESQKKHIGIPVFELDNGTVQNLSYYKYAIVVQYLVEIKKLDFNQICKLETEFDKIFAELVAWSKFKL